MTNKLSNFLGFTPIHFAKLEDKKECVDPKSNNTYASTNFMDNVPVTAVLDASASYCVIVYTQACCLLGLTSSVWTLCSICTGLGAAGVRLPLPPLRLLPPLPPRKLPRVGCPCPQPRWPLLRVLLDQQSLSKCPGLPLEKHVVGARSYWQSLVMCTSC